MQETIEARLKSMGVALPDAAAPAANYVPVVRSGDLLYVSGQLPMGAAGVEHCGRLGDNMSVEGGRDAARLCAINILAQARRALDGDLERLQRIVRITGYVTSTTEFTDQHLVINGASDFLVEALGERGRHARAAIGVISLPLGAAVEIDAIIAAP